MGDSVDIVLAAGPATCTVDPGSGGRLASLQVGGRELLVTRDASTDPMAWGCYPMAPWAGRVRNGRFAFGGEEHVLPCNLPPHAIHGTVFDRPWRVGFADDSHVELDAPLGPRWPFGGRAAQRLHLYPDRLELQLTVQAGEHPMPAQVGWHPWFVKPSRAELHFGRMYQRDAEGIPSGALVGPPAGPWDDCFVEPQAPIELGYDDADGAVTLRLESDCDHWVVYDEPLHATCVEPQSGPPNGFLLRPHVLGPGDSLERNFVISWSRAGDAAPSAAHR